MTWKKERLEKEKEDTTDDPNQRWTVEPLGHNERLREQIKTDKKNFNKIWTE